MSTEQAAFLLPALLPPGLPSSIFGCALRYKIGGSPVINEGKFLPPPLSTNAELRAADIDCVEKFLVLESIGYGDGLSEV